MFNVTWTKSQAKSMSALSHFVNLDLKRNDFFFQIRIALNKYVCTVALLLECFELCYMVMPSYRPIYVFLYSLGMSWLNFVLDENLKNWYFPQYWFRREICGEWCGSGDLQSRPDQVLLSVLRVSLFLKQRRKNKNPTSNSVIAGFISLLIYFPPKLNPPVRRPKNVKG